MRFIVIFLFLGGCSTCPKTAIPVKVEVPVTVSCVASVPQEPKWYIPKLAPDADAADRLRAILADLELSHGYIDVLTAELAACS